METVDLIGLLFVYIYVGSVVLIAIRSRFLSDRGWDRKFIHIMIGNIVFFWWIFQDRYVMALLAAAPFIPLLLYSSLKEHGGGDDIGQTKPRSMGSALVSASLNGHRFGLVYYAISWTLLAYLLFDHRMIASIAIVSMAYGDGMGGLIGKRYGKTRLLGKKTLEGSTAAMVCSAIAILAVIGFYGQLSSAGWFHVPQMEFVMALLLALVVGLFVSYLELITPGELDNLVIPFSVGFVLLLAGV
jgi:phytol kinase